MNKLLIKNATLVNEGRVQVQDVLIAGERIEQIGFGLSAPAGVRVLDAAGKHLLPGMIDDQVHFREPGMPDKGNIASESRAAVAGGTTSFMDMPNVNPQTTTLEALEAKFKLAEGRAAGNYSFYLGGTNDNLEQIQRLQPNQTCGVKVFMGASTGNMLVDSEAALAGIFRDSPVLIATHCEDSPTIKRNEELARAKYGDAVPFSEHGHIRSAEACYLSSSLAVSLAKRYQSKLHVLHLTTAREMSHFTASHSLAELKDKNITAEVCVHHLFYNEADYERLGAQIKCNPAIKTAADQQALIDAVNQDIIDIIATDHAPHTWVDKQNSYFGAPSGLPLCQHALPMLMEFYHKGIFSLETIVRKTSHAVAERYQIKDRGYIREGYFADLVLFDLNDRTAVSKDNLLYHCGWSPLEGTTLKSRVDTTLVNGHIAYQNGQVSEQAFGQRMQFTR
ncbi:dihydroorotase [Zobellella denitrificans]|uniref:Dihydroorotase n=1 Tax=Zobellella denitrificans TaxID=347534 RepID=A0A291HQN1_9GAMM|nr:dihydroorotase [Zobellella denitrificans]ATG74536.1 dihydroorotase [Zobellella denitrificans]